jgi:alpha-beta hydrolase superfamily lysophospholipase
VHAVSKAQKEIRASSYIIVPTLVLYASHSIIPTHQTESLKSADIILNVKHIQQIAPYIGNRICLKQINNAVHDVFLSSKEVRTKAFEEMFLWLEHYE